MPGDLIDKIWGRDDLSMFFSDGRVLLPSSVGDIHGRLLYELKTNKVKHTRITQHSLNKIEIKLVIDKKLREKSPTVEEIFDILRRGYQEKIGNDVEIDIKEVEKVSKKGPRIITKVDMSNFKIKQYI